MNKLADVIQTDRLMLRPFANDDIESTYNWFGDPAVMRFTPSGPDKSIEETAQRIAQYRRHQAEHGYSKWIIIERTSNQTMGDSGLLLLQDFEWIDFGHRLARSQWGKGFATEAAKAWIERAFGVLKIDCLTATVHPENYLSARVLQKLGFQEKRRGAVMGMESIIFCLTPEDRT
jgi:RimJ/RimL family protein N-acetyltransferase